MKKISWQKLALIINSKSPIHLSWKLSITMGQEKRTTLAVEMMTENTELSNTGWTL